MHGDDLLAEVALKRCFHDRRRRGVCESTRDFERFASHTSLIPYWRDVSAGNIPASAGMINEAVGAIEALIAAESSRKSRANNTRTATAAIAIRQTSSALEQRQPILQPGGTRGAITSVSVRSEKGKGATFTTRLPIGADQGNHGPQETATAIVVDAARIRECDEEQPMSTPHHTDVRHVPDRVLAALLIALLAVVTGGLVQRNRMIPAPPTGVAAPAEDPMTGALPQTRGSQTADFSR